MKSDLFYQYNWYQLPYKYNRRYYLVLLRHNNENKTNTKIYSSISEMKSEDLIIKI